ncbi:hypothetical protein, partial [Saccharothrix yanglingensis]
MDVFVDWHAGVGGVDVERLSSRWGADPVLSLPDAVEVSAEGLDVLAGNLAAEGIQADGWPVLEVVGARAQAVVDALGEVGFEAVVARGGRAGHTDVHTFADAPVAPVDAVLVSDVNGPVYRRRSNAWVDEADLVLFKAAGTGSLKVAQEKALHAFVEVLAEQERVRVERGLLGPEVRVTGTYALNVGRMIEGRLVQEGVNLPVEVVTGTESTTPSGVTEVWVEWSAPPSSTGSGAFPVELFWRATPRSRGVAEHPGHPVSLDFAPNAWELTTTQRDEIDALVEDLRTSVRARREVGRPFPVVVVSGTRAQAVQPALRRGGVPSSVVEGGRAGGADVFVDWRIEAEGADGARWGVAPRLSVPDAGVVDPAELTALAREVSADGGARPAGWPLLEVTGPRAQAVVDVLEDAGVRAVVVRGGRAGHTDVHTA